MAAISTSKAQQTYTAVQLQGLVGAEAVPFALYLRTGPATWVLYKPASEVVDEGHLGQLRAEGVEQLYIRDEDRGRYYRRVAEDLDALLRDKRAPLHSRAEVLLGVASCVAEELLAAAPSQDQVRRANHVMMATSSLLLREGQGFQAVRRMLQVGPRLAQHSLTVAMLSMGLARGATTSDPTTLTSIGLAGLLHDVGRVGHDEPEDDPAHAARGADQLGRLGLPPVVVEAARAHHDVREAGAQWPAPADPVVAEGLRIVALADLFEEVYRAHQPHAGVFDALRILAQGYQGRFDDRLARRLVKLFR